MQAHRATCAQVRMSYCRAASPARMLDACFSCTSPRRSSVTPSRARLAPKSPPARARSWCIWFLGRMLAPPKEGQTFQEFRPRSNIYRAQHEALRERRRRTASSSYER